ncbi:MAG: pentapeptide repeat-containing protein [Leptolyngbyaceae cyanobacterium T60_A2020_046]|nr:pentapeptide repeat-containing protein [Leptolyngbyaceae cyanobacterium T60_A2020_046]
MTAESDTDSKPSLEVSPSAVTGNGLSSPGNNDRDRAADVSNGSESDEMNLIEARSPLSPEKSLPTPLILGLGAVLLFLGLGFSLSWLTLVGALLCIGISWRFIRPALAGLLAALSPQQQRLLLAIPVFGLGVFGLMQVVGINRAIQAWGRTIRWEVIGALGDFLGAIGQIFVAMLALYVAWRQYVISRDLTQQQNLITQQQTIDSYFQGVSDLVLDDEGLLEDWPQERIIAEARTAAILGSVDGPGKAKVIRFLSRSKLLTPLKRDRHLGRPILDGSGGYADDRANGVRVINLGAMLAGSDLSGTDLRWTDLSDANLIRADLSRADLVRATLTRTILYYANLAGADLMGAQLFCGSPETASPRSRNTLPNYETGAHTGAVVEGVDFTGVKRMSDAQRQYCCQWCGDRARATIPGGCEGIENRLGR